METNQRQQNPHLFKTPRNRQSHQTPSFKTPKSRKNPSSITSDGRDSPLQNPQSSSSSSSLLRDISNFRTPKTNSRRNPGDLQSPYLHFFTASRQTPASSVSSTIRRGRPRPQVSLAASRLKAFELEQAKSARKVQISKEQCLSSLAKSLTVWLNFLFENPRSCGCDVSKFTREDWSDGSVLSGGKRDRVSLGGVGVDGKWRVPKRARLSSDNEAENDRLFSSSNFSQLQVSLGDICSFDDLKERMRVYLSMSSCKEIFDVMTRVAKAIDDGRLKMKAHCPLVTDLGMKDKAMRTLMCYNPVWLRIGLYIIFGGESLFPDGDLNSEQEVAFLKMVIEKQLFVHASLAKAYAYNKLVDGLYRPGYYEKLGGVILKRFLLFVLILDRAKSHSSLPINYGIDGMDGGSPLLFTLQSNIKSSREVISDFLSSNVMHGEGNLLAHLLIVGYKVFYQQCPLTEYVFKVEDIFTDLRDGVLLCRAVQLLKHDSSLLMEVVVPSHDRKKNLANCTIALRHLKQVGVPLYDEDDPDETKVIADDIVDGDRELILTLLWNMFLHLQLPLLVNNAVLSEEIFKIRGASVELPKNCSARFMLLKWIQAICENYDFSIDNFTSLVDGKAMWCVLDYYFRKEHHHGCPSKDLNATNGEVSIMSASDYTDAVHNFLLSQKLTSLLGNFPEVLQVSDILQYNGACSDRSVVILLVFLASQLIVKKNMDHLNFHKLLGCPQTTEKRYFSRDRSMENPDAVHELEGKSQKSSEDNARNFKAIMAWWTEMAQKNSKSNLMPVYPALQKFSTGRGTISYQRENSARIIQQHFRQSVERRNYLQLKHAVLFLQAVIRTWLMVRKAPFIKDFSVVVREPSYERRKLSKSICRYMTYIVHRHAFIKLRWSVVIIQRATRSWISRRRQGNVLCLNFPSSSLIDAVILIQKCIRGYIARSIYIHRIAHVEKASIFCQENKVNDRQVKEALNTKSAQRKHVNCAVNRKYSAATNIQTHFRGWLLRKTFVNQKQAVTKIQNHCRGRLVRKTFMNQKQAVTKIQTHCRGWLLRKAFMNQKQAVTKIQSHYRGWLVRKSFMNQKQAITKIQRVFRYLKCLRIQQHRLMTRSAITIQSHARGWIARRVANRHRGLIVLIQSHCRGWLIRREFLLQKGAVTRIQSVFRCFKDQKAFLSYRDAAIEFQQFIRGCIARKRLLGASCLCRGVTAASTCATSSEPFQTLELKLYIQSVLKLQRWWRDILLMQARTRSAIFIQSHIRGWIARRIAAKHRLRIAVIQSYWKGYRARKNSRGKLLDLRLRVQKSAANVEDGMRIINRLLAALSELSSMRSVSGILHTCATLDISTQHSQICCEKLVAAGAIDKLLVLIRSVSRSIPDQEVLRHTLSTLRNLTRHPHLTEALIDTRGSVETILQEFIKNKEEAYFIASELLQNICSNEKGVQTICKLPALLKRLHNHVEDLKRKAGNEKRNARLPMAKEQTERRLREAVGLLKLITNR